LELRVPVDLVQLRGLSPAFRLKILRHGVPVIMTRQLLERLISESFSELIDFKISIELARSPSKT